MQTPPSSPEPALPPPPGAAAAVPDVPPPPQTILTLADASDARGVLTLHTDPTRLSATLLYRPNPEGEAHDPAAVMAFLDAAGLRIPPEGRPVIEDLVREAWSSGQPIEDVEILRGHDPVPGEPGRLDWVIEFSRRPSADDVDRIDFREVAEINNVRAGDKLAVLIPPTEGIAGADVLGTPIPAPPGAPLSVSAGNNVRRSDDGHEFFATADGQLLWKDNQLVVDPVLIIGGDVDFSTGNLNFTGRIHIRGNVLDGFKVRGEKGVVIGGRVESAVVESDYDVMICGGISAREKGFVRAGKSLQAKYINSVQVECGGDITVSTEILNSNVSALGKITLSKGSIVGGQVVALGGISAPIIGSAVNVKTSVAAGVHFTREQQMKEVREQLVNTDKGVRRLLDRVGPFLVDPQKIRYVVFEKLPMVKDMLLQLQSLQAVHAQQMDQLMALQTAGASGVVKTVSVLRKLYAGVDVQVGTCRKAFLEDIDGPVRFMANEEAGTVVVRPLER